MKFEGIDERIKFLVLVVFTAFEVLTGRRTSLKQIYLKVLNQNYGNNKWNQKLRVALNIS